MFGCARSVFVKVGGQLMMRAQGRPQTEGSGSASALKGPGRARAMQGFAGRWRAPQDRSGSTSLCAPASAGFTLVEVLVALAIVAVTLAAGLRAAGALVDGSQRLADVTAAQWCAENQLAELRLTRQFPGVGDGDFPCEMLGRRYSGTLRTRPTPNPNFRRVDAIVRDEAQRPLVTVSAIVTRL